MIAVEHSRYAERSEAGTLVIRERTRTRGWRLDIEPSKNSRYLGTLFGHFCVFNRWTKIRDDTGEYMERIAPGAMRTTIADNGIKRMRCLSPAATSGSG